MTDREPLFLSAEEKATNALMGDLVRARRAARNRRPTAEELAEMDMSTRIRVAAAGGLPVEITEES